MLWIILVLSKLIIGSTRGFIRGKTLATLDDISSTGNLKMYSLPNHFNENIVTYNVGFTIQVVIYINLRYDTVLFNVPPVSYYLEEGNSGYGDMQITSTGISFAGVSIVSKRYIGKNLIAFGY